MIAKMLKIWLVCRADDRERTLDALGDLGVLHVIPVDPPAGSALEAARAHATALDRALRILPVVQPPPPPPAGTPLSPDDAADRIRLHAEERDRVTHALHDLRIEITRYAPFGSFEPQQVEDLARTGITVQLVHYNRKHPPRLPGDAQVHLLTQRGSDCYAAVIASGPLDLAGAVPLPRLSLAQLQDEQAAARERLAGIERHIQELAAYRPALEARLAAAQDEVRQLEVSAGMGAAGALVYLQGYCPEDQAPPLREQATQDGWGLLIRPPEPEEEVPTLVRNPAWVRPIKAVFDMIGLLPGYREIDISGVFLIFFSVFFAILIGDAGYGALFLLLTIAARRRWRSAPPYPFTLLKILSVCTIAWGVITGNYFGVTNLPAPLSSLTIDWLREDAGLMLLCFFIGALHLSVAHAWNAIRIINSTRALAQLGWILLTWTMFLTARTMILGADFPPAGYGLLIAGLALVFLFMTPPREFRKDWANHVMLPLDVISNFVDVVSYVRLFAVGSASLAVAAAFNAMALDGGISSIGAGLGAALILFFGHVLNILLCAMGILVHGVRLNTLEFSGHIGMQWTGIPYKPFRRDSGGESER